MKILLIGGGSGGHITPLLAVARELKQLSPSCEIIAVCEQGSAFAHLYEHETAVDRLVQLSAGKYRRYGGLPAWQRALDIKTLLLNVRDVFRTLRGYTQAKQLLKREQPDVLLAKGGFVAVPVGYAAGKLGVPLITHDSDSSPGLANRLIAKYATVHATGMPSELYAYPKKKTAYTGIPVSNTFRKLSRKEQSQLRRQTGLGECKRVVTIIGGSQGGQQLNNDMTMLVPELLHDYPDVGVVHIAGDIHKEAVSERYDAALASNERARVVVNGFVLNPADYTGAADIIVSRASATVIAEVSLQHKALILVPGKLADSHQQRNADYFADHGAAMAVGSGEIQQLSETIRVLLDNTSRRDALADKLAGFAKPAAATELAKLLLSPQRKL